MNPKRKNPKILVAPNAFKESLSATQAAEAISKGLIRLVPSDNIIKLPVADGGDGSLEVLTQYLGLEKREYTTVDPLGRNISAPVSYSSKKEAFIEMACATGLHLLRNNEKDAAHSDSYGTGILIKKAIKEGVNTLNLFVGGTASMDMGTGILRGLGFSFLDHAGNEVPPGGINLGKIKNFSLPAKDAYEHYKKLEIRIFCDVKNALTGPHGAVRTFGSQKDQGKTDFQELEKSFESFAGLLKENTGYEVSEFPGSGAAGGVPAGLSAFLNVNIFEGAEKILEIFDFRKYVQESDIVITGEGKLDQQSFGGKAPSVIAGIAREHNKKVIFIGGDVPNDIEHEAYDHFDAIFSIVPAPVSLTDSIENTGRWLERTAYLIAKMLYL